MKRRDFLSATATGALALAASRSAPAEEPRFPALAAVGTRFSFVIVADPQVGHADDKGRVPSNARRTLLQCTREINAMPAQPAFVVYLGDLVNKFDEKSVANFEACIRDLKAPRVLVHGNHDTHAPYTEFRALMRRQCGFDDVFYSFDAGPWHFIVLPCNLNGNNDAQRDIEAAMLAWLEKDLAANAARPTIIFEHLHTLPIGLAQTEWYTFPLALRRKLMALYTRHGNVRWYFNGHVHNGFLPSVKTSWQFRGINFVNCPTIIEMRNFGEEDRAFVQGIDAAGYYLTVEVDGEELTLTGRRAGQAETFDYPKTFRPFEERLEPRWWTPLNEWSPAPALQNADFAEGLNGWHTTYRYPGGEAPGTEYIARPAGLEIITRSKVSHFWASDEHSEAYQLIAPPAGPHVLDAAYSLAAAPVSGGGYFRLMGLAGGAPAFLMLWHWGEHEKKADYLPRCLDYAIDGAKAQWNFFHRLGEQRKGLYWKLPHAPGAYTLTADLATLFEAVHGPGAYAALGLSGLLIAVGTWCNRGEGSRSAATFQRAVLTGAAAPSQYTVNGMVTPLSVGPEIHQITFAADLIAKQHAPKRKKVSAA